MSAPPRDGPDRHEKVSGQAERMSLWCLAFVAAQESVFATRIRNVTFRQCPWHLLAPPPPAKPRVACNSARLVVIVSLKPTLQTAVAIIAAGVPR
jgi:hypothetical protein